MPSIIAVRVDRRGEVRDGHKTVDTGVAARCDLCGAVVDAVASLTPEGSGAFACKSCLRMRLEAITVALYELREPGGAGLPWGKVSG
ncbi:MAG: hypothetical protein K1X88_22185 [Nannocystaceae bacterium]|nr:hypothetical protein [Nannocystaceae bacterium]